MRYINLVLKSCQIFFLGYALHAGRIWKGDILVPDIEELEQLKAPCKGSVDADER